MMICHRVAQELRDGFMLMHDLISVIRGIHSLKFRLVGTPSIIYFPIEYDVLNIARVSCFVTDVLHLCNFKLDAHVIVRVRYMSFYVVLFVCVICAYKP